MTSAKSTRSRLFIMMVMEFFIWGAWLPLIFSYLPSLGFSTTQQAWILNAFPLSAIVGMFFSNQFADRHFAAERFLGLSHLIGGLAILGLGFTREFWPFFVLMLVHCLFYVPTISIANSIAFTHMKDAQKEFGFVRMGGTIGWILAAWPFTFILVDWARVKAAAPHGVVAWLGTALGSGLTGQALRQATRWTFIVAGVVSLGLAAYSLLLPHTPPKKKKLDASAAERFAWLEAVRLLKHPFVLILWFLTFIDAFVHNSYFNWTGSFLGARPEAGGVGIPGNWIMPVMSLGQVSEILTMLALGAVLKKLGWRMTMLIGILGHAGRFAVYAFFPSQPWMIVAIQVLHGICYAFFFATVYIFVDAYFPKDVRSSAQGLFNVMILGIGVLAANSLCPWLIQSVFTVNGVTDFRSMFLLPCLTALGAAIVLAVAFRPPARVELGQGPS
ncbi:MAG: nucleoside:proton symporter [Candidatus Aminicenantes bacterium RBG_13_64_14]|nr:MAG: nucleoside:proton symporter [Candidatus Aminicenantes bacterium RBG_13_64_14]